MGAWWGLCPLQRCVFPQPFGISRMCPALKCCRALEFGFLDWQSWEGRFVPVQHSEFDVISHLSISEFSSNRVLGLVSERASLMPPSPHFPAFLGRQDLKDHLHPSTPSESTSRAPLYYHISCTWFSLPALLCALPLEPGRVSWWVLH